MNFFDLMKGPISALNPNVNVLLTVNTGGVTIAPGGKQTPVTTQHYAKAQVQPLSSGDLEMTTRLNLQGVSKKIYLDGALPGIIRAAGQGGSLATLPDGTVWKVTMVTEQWMDGVSPTWACAYLTEQDNS